MVINHEENDEQRRWPMKKVLYLALAVLGVVVLLFDILPRLKHSVWGMV